MRPRRVTARDQPDGLEDVQDEYRQQAKLRDVDQRIADELVRILIERVGPGEEEQIAGEVCDQEDDEK